jgi:hypothetical protein
MQLVIVQFLLVLFANARHIWAGRVGSLRSVAQRTIAVALVSIPLVSCASGAFDEEFGDTRSSVGSISLNPFVSKEKLVEAQRKAQRAAELEVKSASGTTQSPIEQVLNQIPSYKYYKIIGAEYSKRSAGFDGSVNPLMPLM